MAHVAVVTAAGRQPNYDTLTMRPEPQFATSFKPSSSTAGCNIEAAIREHHDRMEYYRTLSGHNDPVAEATSLQSQPELLLPTFWQSLWGCFRCRD